MVYWAAPTFLWVFTVWPQFLVIMRSHSRSSLFCCISLSHNGPDVFEILPTIHLSPKAWKLIAASMTIATGFLVKGTQQHKKKHKKNLRCVSRGLARVAVTRAWLSLPPSGWYEGERLRDGEAGWFPAECGEAITCQATIERNMQRMDRLQGLETNVWAALTERPSDWTFRLRLQHLLEFHPV